MTTKDDRPVIYIDDKDLEEGLKLGLVRYVEPPLKEWTERTADGGVRRMQLRRVK